MSRGRKPKTTEAKATEIKVDEVQEAQVEAAKEEAVLTAPAEAVAEVKSNGTEVPQVKKEKTAKTKKETAPKTEKTAKKEKTAKTEKKAAKSDDVKTETVKKETAKKPAKATKEVKESVKKKVAPAAEKKEKTKEKVVKGFDAKVVFQANGREIEPKVVLERAKEAWLARGHKPSEIKSMELYIKPEENAAYYVINGISGDENKVDL